jgi:hypothetical protein
MLTLKKFLGIDNVRPSERLVPTRDGTPLARAMNVDVGVDNELRRRVGFTQTSSVCHKNVWEGDGFVLATKQGGDLVSIVDGNETVLYSSLGVSPRVWYCNFPDGRTAFSNGNINGLVTAGARTGWGVPIPASAGDLQEVSGSLFAGDYQWQITYVRLSDSLEGGAAYSDAPVTLTMGGIVLTNLPTLAGYKINVYLTSANSEEAYFAGSTTNSMFSYTGQNKDLVRPCKTNWMFPAPVGTLSAMWRGRALVAVDDVLYASRHGQPELFDLRNDYKRFADPITLIQPVDEGLFVGTQTELAYLTGTKFNDLTYTKVVNGGVALGSGVTVRGEWLKRGDSVGSGQAMVCIADKYIVAGFSDGNVQPLTAGRYTSSVAEVAAAFRMRDGIPQYFAVAQ